VGDIDDFRQWLSTNAKLHGRSAKDSISRFKRATIFVSLAPRRPVDEFLLELNRNPDFQRLSETVRSQLRRSVRLYYRYQASNASTTACRKAGRRRA